MEIKICILNNHQKNIKMKTRMYFKINDRSYNMSNFDITKFKFRLKNI